ncbi:hypothetical protein D5E69_14285 [Rossellomorea marisflavi]|uniref:hypothetical protein n=1 Tax=Rossellomorea marisflavi TaxID=189381 RepID=UPI00131932EF|nr:hypothetical protein [Rossellomorea marisflavi]QHA36867.1 hypothetical protein D5E69_14285 [Rossellomorea marisflavi]
MLIEKQGEWFTVQGEALTLVPQTRKVEHVVSRDGEVVGKRCGGLCGEMLPVEKFAKCSKGFAKKRSYCKTCEKLRLEANRRGEDVYGNKKRPIKAKAERLYADGVCVRKKCPTCDEWKDADDYYIMSGSQDKLSTSCKKCHGQLMKVAMAKDPERYKTYGHNRRAKEAALPGDLSPEAWELALDHFDHACALTGATENIHLEHAIPIAIGHGGTVEWNCYPLEGTLNNSKSATNLFEWAKGRSDIDKTRFNRLITFLADQCGLTVDEYRDFYDWCFRNPRLTVEEIEADGGVDSLNLWHALKN